MAKDVEVGVRLKADTGGLVKGTTIGRGELAKLQKSMKETAVATRSAGAAFDGWKDKLLSARGLMVGIATGAMASFAKRSLDTIESTQRMAQSLGTTTGKVQELAFAFAEFGADQNDVADALNTLADRAQDATDGTRSMIDDFGLLGISVDQLRNKRPDELFSLFARGVSSIEDPTKRASAVVRLLGDDIGRKLMPLLMQGDRGLAGYAQRAHELGAVLSDEMIVQSVEANKQLRAMAFVLDARLKVALAENAGLIEGMGGALTDLVEVLGKAEKNFNLLSAAASGFVGSKAAKFLFGARFGVAGAIAGIAGAIVPDMMFAGTSTALEDINAQIAEQEALVDQMIKQASSNRGPMELLAGTDATAQVQEATRALQALYEARQKLREKPVEGDPLIVTGKARQIPNPLAGMDMLERQRLMHLESDLIEGAPSMSPEAIKRQADMQAEVARLFEQTRTPVEAYNAQLERLGELVNSNAIDWETYSRAAELAAKGLDRTGDATDGVKDKLAEIALAVNGFGRQFEDELINAAKGGADAFGNMTDAILEDIARLTLRMSVINPAVTALAGDGKGNKGLIGAGVSAVGSWFNPTKSANGNVFSNGNVIPFAAGGIVSRPTLFPMANGTGLMGEAGPEAIVPLKRGPDGKLGVTSQGGGDVRVNVFNNGQPMEATVSQRRVGTGREIDIYLENKIKGIVTGGALDRTFANNYGLKRRGY